MIMSHLLRNLNTIFIKKKIFLIIIIISLSVNILNLKNYGYAWDDGLMRLTGFVNLKHIVKIFIPEIEKKYERLKKVSNLNDWRDRYYGPSFETFAATIEVLTGSITNNKNLDDKKKIYYLRCILLLIFLHSCYLIYYKMNLHLTKNYFLSNLSVLLLILFPRFFAEQHYNTKDLYLCGLVILSLYFGIKLINKIKIKNLIFFSFFSALCISTKLSTALLPLMVMIFSVIKYGLNKKIIKLIIFTFLLFIFFFYLTFPFLWADPFTNFLEVFNKLSNHSWNGKVLYFGEVFKGTKTPWHYIIMWFLITVPILYLILFLFFLIFIFTRKIFFEKNFNIIYLNLLLFVLTIFFITIFQKNTYNGWRHSYFVLIYFLIFISCTISNIQWKKLKIILLTLITIAILNNIIWILRNHPYENVYFNFFVKEPYQQFDLDWWGLSNNEQIKFILENDKRKTVTVMAVSGTSLEATRKNMLSNENMKKLIVVYNIKDANYLINNYINNKKDYSNIYKKINEISVSGKPINTLYKIN